ncbi:MAG: ATP synthase F0 subunit B [Spirochaetales bacterium]|nr:ATP synthase F0 subunit B [Spirochaetales bacterium]
MDLFKLEPGLAIWTWITFGILFFILARYVIPAILKNLQEREDYIHSSVDKTAEVEKRLKDMESERDEILKKAEVKADEMLLRIRQEGEELRQKLAKQAEKEASEILNQARIQAEQERGAMLESLKGELADIICSATEEVVGMTVVGEKEREISRELVNKL